MRRKRRRRGGEADRHRKLISVRTSFTPKVSTRHLDWRLVDKMAVRRGCQQQRAQVGSGVAQEPEGMLGNGALQVPASHCTKTC